MGNFYVIIILTYLVFSQVIIKFDFTLFTLLYEVCIDSQENMYSTTIIFYFLFRIIYEFIIAEFLFEQCMSCLILNTEP